jgi:hypothetical protein
MPIRWMSAYAAALQEQDPEKLPTLCDEARRAINDRILELGSKLHDSSEREQLEEALRQLTIHETKRKRDPN